MEESHIEDLVNHDDPESCVYCCKAIDEALTGAHIGRVLSCENRLNQDADVVVLGGKQHEQERNDKSLLNPAQSETSCMYGNPLHENREIPFSPTRSISRTCWEGGMPKPTMNENGKSDNSIVSMKQLNEVVQITEEIVERRELTKENVGQQNAYRTQCRNNAMPNELERIRRVAKRKKDVKFTALLHHITINRLREAFFSLKRGAAPGIDGETWVTYEIKLEENLEDLHQRTHNGSYKAKPSSQAAYRRQLTNSRLSYFSITFVVE